MDGYGFDLALVGVLVVINALFAGSEIALISLRESQLEGIGRRGGRGAARLAELARNPNRFLATIQIGITLAGFLASATAAVSLAEPLAPLFSFAGGAAEPVAVAVVTLVLTFVTLVVGELAPKRLAMQFSERWALMAATPLHILAKISRPAVWALGHATDLLVRLLGGNPDKREEPPPPEELRDMVISHHGLTAQQREIISSALEMHERPLRTALVPRREVFGLGDGMTAGEARAALAEAGHSRAPVVSAGHVDDILGVVRLRELITSDDATPVTEMARPAPRLPDFMRLSEALRHLMAAHEQFALVVDEHGSVEGIVTLEDLLEEIVGEIYDETEQETASAYTEADGTIRLPGTFPLHDLRDAGINLGDHPPGTYTTIAGLALALLGRVPERPGDRVEIGDWRIEVTSVDHHAITAVRLHPDSHRDTDRTESAQHTAGPEKAGE
ncbi:hemolysin family protein [Yinghuangia sp. YIM S10712]|uniref:hemolysin family protein n=1 Tax=Yinghuangia sp. YIM S10712 TaxID=3436930 RepID=UPI003F52FBFD